MLQMLNELILNTLLIQTWVPNPIVNASLNGVSWYLSVALFCYIIFPISIKFIYKIKDIKGYIIAMGLAIIIQFIFSCVANHLWNIEQPEYEWFLYHFPPVRCIEFVEGNLLGAIYLRTMDKKFEKVKTPWNVFFIFIEAFLIVMYLAGSRWIGGEHISFGSSLLANWILPYLPLTIGLMVIFSYLGGYLHIKA